MFVHQYLDFPFILPWSRRTDQLTDLLPPDLLLLSFVLALVFIILPTCIATNICHLFACLLLATWVVSEVECIALYLFIWHPQNDFSVCACMRMLQELRLVTGFLSLETKIHWWTEVCLDQFALVLYEVPCCIQMITAHSPHGETWSARGMKLPRAVWGLVFHWSFNNMIWGFVNKGLQMNAEFCRKPVEGAEGLEDLLERSAGVCVSKWNKLQESKFPNYWSLLLLDLLRPFKNNSASSKINK